ncbi:MAG TPA: fluoride efflux transporter CrcB [Gemmatales bacterium]|nr:fluoride efflux transporter CrcB [Gemmatales bacterium]
MMHPIVWKYSGILLFGGLGSVARFGLTELVEYYAGKAFPLGTMLVNILGCLVFGILWAIASKGAMSEEWRVILLVGFLGGFTTFSSFAFHNEQMMVQGQWSALLVNVLVQNVVGVAAVWVGVKVVS